MSSTKQHRPQSESEFEGENTTDIVVVEGEEDWLTALEAQRHINHKVEFESLLGTGASRATSHGVGFLGSSSSSSPSPYSHHHHHGVEGLQLCTEGLGFESSDENDSTASSPRSLQRLDSVTERSVDEEDEYDEGEDQKASSSIMQQFKHHRNVRTSGMGRIPFPPPLPSMSGRNGKGPVRMKSFKREGRFVLQEVKLGAPQKEVLHAWRGDGRLKLSLVNNNPHCDSDNGNGNGNGSPDVVMTTMNGDDGASGRM